MSIHYIPDDTDRTALNLLAFLGNHSLEQVQEPGRTACTILPDLTPAQATRFDELVANARFTDAEMDALRPDIEGLKTYHGLASPTAAQTALATKAIIRILRAVFRD